MRCECFSSVAPLVSDMLKVAIGKRNTASRFWANRHVMLLDMIMMIIGRGTLLWLMVVQWHG